VDIDQKVIVEGSQVHEVVVLIAKAAFERKGVRTRFERIVSLRLQTKRSENI